MSSALSLTNTLASTSALLTSPSACDGVSAELEHDLRVWGCELVQRMGLHLRLPQVAVGTGQVLFQRFFYRRSMLKFGVEDVAMASLYLAAKIEECPRRSRDIINTTHYLRWARQQADTQQSKYEPLDFVGTKHDEMKLVLVQTEKHILKNLGYNVHVQHPHKLVINFCKLLGIGDGDSLVQLAWNYMNDSFRTNAFVRYQPNVIACAVILLAARALKRPLPLMPPWWSFYDATLPDMLDIGKSILYLYTRDITRPDLPVTTQELRAHLAAHPATAIPSTIYQSPERADTPGDFD